jgi:hypothetical protein
MERTHEEPTEALHAGRESRHPEAHLLEQVSISELLDRHGLQPTVFYRWQKEFFENGAAAAHPRRATGSWTRRGSDGRLVASKPLYA